MNDDLISREALLNGWDVNWVYEYDETGTSVKYKAIPVEAIEKAPAVDAEEVVYCKDCVYRGNSCQCPMCFDKLCWNDDDGSVYVTHDNTVDEGFCHCGTREE